MLHRTLRFVLLTTACATLGACSSDTNTVRDLAMASGITGGEPKPAPDFVSRTRPADPEFMPIGRQPPPRATRAKSKDAVASAEGDLARTRSFNEARGNQARRAGAGPAPTVPAAPPPDE